MNYKKTGYSLSYDLNGGAILTIKDENLKVELYLTETELAYFRNEVTEILELMIQHREILEKESETNGQRT